MYKISILFDSQREAEDFLKSQDIMLESDIDEIDEEISDAEDDLNLLSFYKEKILELSHYTLCPDCLEKILDDLYCDLIDSFYLSENN